MHEKILIVDFGSQYTQLIARRVREINVYCEIVPYNKIPALDKSIKGVILSGSPFSVRDENAPRVDLDSFIGKKPVLGICYGAQYLAHAYGGIVLPAEKREYGRAVLLPSTGESELLSGVGHGSQVWMSHADTIVELPKGFHLLAKTDSIEVAAFDANSGRFEQPVLGLQFHPEVTHSIDGKKVLENFIIGTCGCSGDWTPAAFVEETVDALKASIGDEKVVLGLSGGVDSSVAAVLFHQAIGENLYCVFVDNGLLRKNEFGEVLKTYQGMGLYVIGVDAKDAFISELKGIFDPEEKRKTIGRVFVEVFQHEAEKLEGVKWLGQGTIYPDVIESVSVHGPSATIKSHHNVGGLPELLHLKVSEPLKYLFKDEVRRVGRELKIKDEILSRHPFPGPGLAIRIMSDVTESKVALLQEADYIFINNLNKSGWYDKVWQAFVVLLPVQSVGVMGDERTYENVVALRAVSSVDGMTADWSELPFSLLADTSNEIINNVKGVNRVVYDISSKPPATIEWE